jgi:hypothetical protein
MIVLLKREHDAHSPDLIDRSILSLEHHILPGLVDEKGAYVLESNAFWMQVKAPG